MTNIDYWTAALLFFSSSMHCLVTWWLGYIWSHCVVALINAWHTVTILDNLSNTDHAVYDRLCQVTQTPLSLVIGDVGDQSCLSQIFSSQKIDAVFHFAALKAVGESCQQPGRYFANNSNGLITLLNTMLAHTCTTIIFSSSCTVYGTPHYFPLDEHHPRGATTNPYGTTKYLAERVLEDYAQFAWLSVICLRYFNPIGAHPSGLLGELPRGIPNNLLPYVLGVVSGMYDHVRVFGDDYPTRDGSGIRDYIDVLDLCQWHICAWTKHHQQVGFHVYNLGTGRGISVLEMIDAVRHVSGHPVPFRVYPRRDGDIAEIFADASTAYKELWRMATTTVDESIANMLRFETMKKN